MSVRHVLSVAAAALALAALTACSSAQTPAPAAPAAPSASAAPGGSTSPTSAQGADAAAAHQGASALAALGALGQEKGSTDQIRTLGAQIATDTKALDDQLRAIASAAGITLSDAVGADQQAVLADLQNRSGAQFDQAWIRAVLDLQQQVKASAEAVLNSPNATEEQKAAARAALANLDAAVAKLQAALAGGGGEAPTSVDSGTGGQAAEDGLPFVALGLLGAGALLLGGAVRAARR